MKKTNTLALLGLALAATVGLASCDNGPNGPSYDTYINFATLTGDTGKSCSFEVQKSNADAPVTLTANVELNSTFNIGNRYVIYYSNENAGPFAAGPISLESAFAPLGGVATITEADSISVLTSDRINVMYVNNVSKWLDVQASAYLSNGPKAFGVFVDKATVTEEYPEAYIGFRTDNMGAAQQWIFYGSFDITPIKRLPNAKGINLTYTTNNTKTTQKIDF